MQAIDEARTIYHEAREHKRLEAVERRRARDGMERLRRFCEANGIKIEQIRRTEADGHGHAGGSEDT